MTALAHGQQLKRVLIALVWLLGSVVLVGWLIAALLVSRDPSYSTRQRWMAWLLPPGGLFGLTFIIPAGARGTSCLGSTGHALVCSGSAGLPSAVTLVLLAFVVVGSLYTTWRLATEPGTYAISKGRREC